MPVRPYDQNKTFLLPPSLNEWVTEKNPVRIFSKLVDRLNISRLHEPQPTGRPSYDRRMLLKVLLWAYVNGIRSSRKIERLLCTDIEFMWLAGMERPDFRTICLFRACNWDAIEDLFAQVVLLAQELGIVRLGLVAIDGTKMRASAGVDSFRQVQKWREELQRAKDEVRKVLEEAEALDREEDERYGSDRRGDELPEGLEDAQEWVQKIEGLLRELEELGEDEEIRVSMTDPDARFMHSKKGSLPAYNAQAAVTEDQFIVYADVTNEPIDVNQLLPALDGTAAVCKERPQRALADAGYISGRNYAGLEERKIDGYIPETEERHIGKQQRGKKSDLYKKRDFKYNKEQDCYVCPAGRELVRKTQARVKTKYSEREMTFYRPKERGVCLKCPLKAKCTETMNPVGRTVSRDKYEEERERMREKIKSKEGKKIYAKRKCTIEPVFGQIRVIERFVQFLLRGLKKVRIEWKWAAIAHNMLKIIRKVESGEVSLEAVT